MDTFWNPTCPAGDHDDLETLRQHFDPVSSLLTRGRYTRIAGRLATECPVTHSDQIPGGIWAVSGYRELQELHRDDENFSNYPVVLQNFGNVRPMIPMEIDPPLHRQYRQIVAPLLTRAVQIEREPYFRSIAQSYLATFLERGSCDLFEEYCAPLPVHVLMETLGVPSADRAHLSELAIGQVRGRGDEVGPAIYEYFAELAAKKRNDPADDILSHLCTATVDGRPLTEEEILDYCVLLLPAGFETTASSMSYVLLLLAELPELQSELRRQPEKIPQAIEEIMRYVTPTRSHTRTVTSDVTLGGRELKAGDRVHVNWVGANHDSAVFEHHDELRIDRRPNPHMGFGFGAHTCVGMHMARSEMKVAVEELLSAVDDLRLTDPADVVEEVGTTWGVTRLPVVFSKRS